MIQGGEKESTRMVAQGPQEAGKLRDSASMEDTGNNEKGFSSEFLRSGISSLDRLTRELQEIKTRYAMYSARLEAWEQA